MLIDSVAADASTALEGLAMSEMTELLRRAEQARVLDRELDARLWCVRSGWQFVGWDGRICTYRQPGTDSQPPKVGYVPGHHFPSYTDNLNQALGLVGVCLPGWRLRLEGQSGDWAASLRDGNDQQPEACRSTPALAIILAVVRVLARGQES